jgi:hypothetical protein
LALALQAHRDLPAKVEEAYRAAHRLACHEWSVRQFIGGPAQPSPRIADAIAGGCERSRCAAGGAAMKAWSI